MFFVTYSRENFINHLSDISNVYRNVSGEKVILPPNFTTEMNMITAELVIERKSLFF